MREGGWSNAFPGQGHEHGTGEDSRALVCKGGRWCARRWRERRGREGSQEEAIYGRGGKERSLGREGVVFQERLAPHLCAYVLVCRCVSGRARSA